MYNVHYHESYNVLYNVHSVPLQGRIQRLMKREWCYPFLPNFGAKLTEFSDKRGDSDHMNPLDLSIFIFPCVCMRGYSINLKRTFTIKWWRILYTMKIFFHSKVILLVLVFFTLCTWLDVLKICDRADVVFCS